MGTSGYSSGYYRVINGAWNVINNFLECHEFSMDAGLARS